MRSISILLFFAIIIGSCNKQGCTDPLASNYDSNATEDDGSCNTMLNINFNITHNGEVLEEYDIFEKDGKSFRLETMRYYLSHLKLISNDGNSEEIEVHLFDIDKEYTHQATVDVESKIYTSIEFNLGLDATLNNSDPNSFPSNHPLSSSNNTFWSMEPASYMFVMFEGKIDTLGGDNFDYPKTYHLAHKTLLREVKIEHLFDFVENNNITINLNINISKMFTEIDINEDVPHTVSSNVIANDLMTNIANAFVVE